MKSLYLITVPQKDDKPYRFVTDELSHVSFEYDNFLVEKLVFDNVE